MSRNIILEINAKNIKYKKDELSYLKGIINYQSKEEKITFNSVNIKYKNLESKGIFSGSFNFKTKYLNALIKLENN